MRRKQLQQTYRHVSPEMASLPIHVRFVVSSALTHRLDPSTALTKGYQHLLKKIKNKALI